MAKTVLGIQLTPGEAFAVRVRAGWNRCTVTQALRRPREAPSPERLAQFTPSSERADVVVAALPADEVFRRDVTLPFTDLRKLAQAAPLEAEESLPLPLEEVVHDVAILGRSPEGTRVMVVAAPLSRVEHLLSNLRTVGLEPQIVDAEPLALAAVARRAGLSDATALLLDVSEHLSQALILREGKPETFYALPSGARTPELLREVEGILGRLASAGAPATAIYLSGPAVLDLDEEVWTDTFGLPVRRLPFPAAGVQVSALDTPPWPTWAIPLGLALRAAFPRSSSRVNLLSGPFAPPLASTPWRPALATASAYIAVLLSLWATAQWIEASQLEAQVSELRAAIRSTFQATLPDVRNVVSEVDQLRAKVAEMEERDRGLAALTDPDSSPVRMLRDLSAKIPRDVEVELRDLAIDAEHLRIEGTTTSFRESERIKAAVTAAFPGLTSVSSDAKDGDTPGEVLFTLALTRARKG